jgi:hypothetical protein
MQQTGRKSFKELKAEAKAALVELNVEMEGLEKLKRENGG